MSFSLVWAKTAVAMEAIAVRPIIIAHPVMPIKSNKVTMSRMSKILSQGSARMMLSERTIRSMIEMSVGANTACRECADSVESDDTVLL